MMNARRGRELPAPQPGTFGSAAMNSYMWGFWFGIGSFLSSWLSADLARGQSGHFLVALGLGSIGWAKFWTFILFLVSINPISQAVREYHRVTGRGFIEDRIGFAKAGGQDIGTFAGLVSTTSCVLIFAQILPTWVVSWVRVPLIIVSSLILGKWLARVLSRRAFAVLFGDSSGM